jgi:membrane associated rhomboid family serine protease
VIWTCAALLAIHVARMLMPSEMENAILFRGALIPELLDQGAPYWWTLLTYTFLHSGIGHVLVNSAMILALGSAVARLTSGAMFMTIFLLSGLGGGVAIYLFTEHNSVTVGASGALSGLIGAAAVLMYRYRDTDPRARMMGFMVAIVVVMNVLMAFSGGSGVSWQAHLGGLIAGAVYGYAVIGRTPTPRGPRPIN